MPALVFESVNDAEADRTACPTDAAGGANIGRKQLAPTTPLAARRMAASLTPWRGKRRCPRPATAAHHAVLAAIERALANDARARKQKV
jgi:hypothetical protein